MVARRLLSLFVAALVVIGSGAIPAEALTGSTATIESRTLSYINGGRSRVGKTALRPSSSLASIARRHSAAQSLRGYISHSGFSSRVRGYSAACENVAMYRPAGSVSTDAVARKFYSLWYNSISHRNCMLDRYGKGYRLAGLGIHRDARGAYWATLELVR